MKNGIKFLIGIITLVIFAIVIAAINTQYGSAVLMAPLLLAGFTDEQTKSFSEWIEKQSQEIQAKVKSLVDAAKEGELIKELTALVKGDGKAKGLPDIINEMQKQLDAQNLEIQKAGKKTLNDDELVSLEKAIKTLVLSEEFKKAKAEGFRGNPVFQVKAATSDITGTVNMTLQRLQVGFAPEQALAFIPYCNVGFVGNDKNRVLWVEGAYTSNVGYVGEGTGQGTADTGAAVEKTRGMAKISAKLPLTAELLEDADYIASAFRMKMQEKALIFADNEVYEGDGNDSTQPAHIYGIKGHATAFASATVPTGALVENANIGDLVDACVLQAEVAEQRGINKIWINPKDFFRFKTAKDSFGNYLFVKDVNGSYTINGLDVIRTNAVDPGELLLADSAKMQLWWKRNPEIKFSQMNGTDFVDDKYTAVMFLRAQVVVEAQDKTALIYVSDIDTAITAITKTGA